MSVLDIKPADQCRYDMIALGEIMLRLDPGDGRVRTARHIVFAAAFPHIELARRAHPTITGI